MIDFSASTDVLYSSFGADAIFKESSDAIGTECTVLFDYQGQEETEYGIAATARIVVRKMEIPSPGRGNVFLVSGGTWRAEFILSSEEGTNELETALACIEITHLARGLK